MKHRSGWKARFRAAPSVAVIAARISTEHRQAQAAAIDAPTVPITIVKDGALNPDWFGELPTGGAVA